MNLTAFTRRCCKIRNPLIREFLSEIICTFMLISFGLSSVAQFTLGQKNEFNSFLSINMTFGAAVTIAIIIGGKISGAQMNPAVSLSMLMLGNLTPFKFLIYIIGQCIGALLGSVSVYLVNFDGLNAFDGGSRLVIGVNATAGIWATYPGPHLSTWGAFFDQFFATTLLIIAVLAIGDQTNSDIPQSIKALLNGVVVFLIGTGFGWNCGYAINPVRDFIPRVFTSFSGWGSGVFTAHNYYFWIPIVGPLVGSVFGTYVYVLMIGNHWPSDKKLSF